MPTGFHIASAWVDIKAEDKGLREQISSIVKKAAAGQDAKVNVSIDSKGLRSEFTRAVKEATKGQGVKVPVKIDSKGLRAEFDRAVKEATRGKGVKIPVHIDSKGLRAEMTRAVREATAGQGIKIPVKIDSAGLRGEINRAMRAATSGQGVKIPIKIDSAGLRGEVNRAVRVATAGQRGSVTIRANTAPATTAIRGLSRDLDNAGGHASRMQKIAMAAFVAINPAAALTSSLIRSIGPSTATSIPALLSLVTIGAALKVGFKGVGLAISKAFAPSTKATAKAFGQTMATLAPAAQSFVRAMVALRPAFSALKMDVQQTLFKGWADELNAMSTTVLPVFDRGLSGMAGVLNTMGKYAAETLIQLTKMGTLDKMFGGLTLAMKPLVKVPGQFLQALVQMSAAASPLFIRMTTAFGNAATSVSNKLTLAFNDGRLQAAITKSGNNIANFFRKIANNPEWKQFLANAKTQGPIVAKALGHIAEAALKIVNSFGPLSGAILKVVDALAKIIIAMPPGLLTTILGVIAGLKLFAFVGKGIMAAGKALMVLRGALMLLSSQAAMSGAISAAMSRIGMSSAQIGGSAVGIGRTATALRGLGRAAIVVGVVLAIGHGIDWIASKFSAAKPNVDKLVQSFGTLSAKGKVTGEAARVMGGNFDKLQNSIARVAHPAVMERIRNGFERIGNAIGLNGGKLQKAQQTIHGVDDALAKMVSSGHGSAAAAVFSMIEKKAVPAGTSVEKLKSLFPKYAEAVKKAHAAQVIAAASMGVFGAQAIATKNKLDAQQRSAEGLKGSYEDLNNAARMAMGGEIGMEAAIDAATKSVKDNGRTLDINTEKGRNNKSALLGLAQATDQAAGAAAANGESWDHVNGIYQRGHSQLVKVAMQMGLTASQANKLASQILSIPNRDVRFSANLDDLNSKIVQAQAKVDKLKQKSPAQLRANGGQLQREKDVAQRALDALKQRRAVMIRAEITSLSAEIRKAQNKINGLKQKRKTAVGADKARLDATIVAAQKHLDALKQKRAAAIKARDNTAAGVGSAKRRLDSLHDRTVTVTVNTVAGSTATHKSIANAIAAQAAAQAKKKATGGIIHRAMGGVAHKAMGFAAGTTNGPVAGPGSGTSDSIPALLSNGEFVIKATSVKKYGQGMMDALNTGKFPYVLHPSPSPRYALGGAVGAPSPGAGAASPSPSSAGASPVTKGTTPSTKPVGANALVTSVQVLANTQDIDAKLKATQNLLNTFAKKLPAPIPLKALDATKAATTTAAANLKSVPLVATQTYAALNASTTAFGVAFKGKHASTGAATKATWSSLGSKMKSTTTGTYSAIKGSTAGFATATVQKLQSTERTSQTTWNSYKSGMTGKTKQTYSSMKSATQTMASSTVNKLQATHSASMKTWDSFKSGMISRTAGTYSSIKKGTGSFGSQTVTKFGQIKNSVGKAWDGVRPKLAAPIHYLIGSVINKGVVPAMNSVVNKLGGSGSLKSISNSGFATGGYVSGDGGPTSDSIPARLSNGEFVMRAAAVKKYGVSHMAAMNAGNMGEKAPLRRAMGGPIGFAGGGLAMVTGAAKGSLEKMLGSYKTSDYKKLADWIWEEAIEPLLEKAPGGSAMQNVIKSGSKLMQKQATGYLEANIPDPNAGGGNIAGATKWADAQIGKPYVWGGAGPGGYDCSGFMSGIQKVIQNKSPYGRLWSTQAFSGKTAPAGWEQNLKAPFEIGITNAGVGHTAGTLGGVNYEATPPVLRKGKGARGAHDSMFTSHYGFKPSMGGLGNYKPGAGVAQWAEVTKQALTEAHQSTALANTVLHQMQTESGGNPRAVNLTDSNAQAGYPSVGLMQVIRPTFRAYAGSHVNTPPQAYGVSEDPLSNIYASIKYVLAAYGSVAAGMRGVAYAAGGPVKGPGTGTSDSIQARLSNGEFVMQSSAVKRFGTGFMDAVNTGHMPGFATGGSVGTASATSNYTIKSGDTLSEIAQTFHTTVRALMDLNQTIKDANKIQAGAVIKVPGTSGGTSGGGTGGTGGVPSVPVFAKMATSAAEAAATETAKVTRDRMASKAGIYESGDLVPSLTSDVSDWAGMVAATQAALTEEHQTFAAGAERDALDTFMTNSGVSLAAWQKQLDTNTASLTDATTALSDIQSSFDSLKTSVAQSVVSFGAISKVAKYGTSMGTIITQLQTDVSTSTAFASQLEQLKAKGISGDLIQQVAEMGATGGGTAAATSLLSATPAQIAQLNDLQKQLVTVGDRTGQAAADAMYGAGVQAAQGIVDGLTSQKASITAAILSIAKSMETAIRQALGIQSPSRVMRKLFKWVPLGAAQGITDGVGHVETALKTMCSVPNTMSAAATSGPTAATSGTMNSGYGHGGMHIENLNVTISVDANVDINQPNAARDFARKLGPAIKEELRRSDRERR